MFCVQRKLSSDRVLQALPALIERSTQVLCAMKCGGVFCWRLLTAGADGSISKQAGLSVNAPLTVRCEPIGGH